ncbi:MAG: quinone-dependent dihydroorotate dehydrogenase [Candidatus Dadabacteria bacterium]|nr:quinone-dependent dihydroorotate dehydrogenase [Candidatus Dadabacteria bacterium]
MFHYQSLKKYLFKLDPESSHDVSEFVLRKAKHIPFCLSLIKRKNFITNHSLKQNIFGREFLNPVGLAAGFDKNATIIETMPALGFGFVEVGTVTPEPQSGNPKPRLFRFPKEESLENSMGFNNDGMVSIQKRLRKVYPFTLPIGVNIGKNRTTRDDKAIEDYTNLIEGFKDFCDYLVINISSPNTPGLRELQNEVFIKSLFSIAKQVTSKPVFLKISPDIEASEAVSLSSIAVQYGASGIIATNTSVEYTLLPNAKKIGGISGRAIKDKSFHTFDEIAKELYGKTLFISVGGIDSGVEAYRRIKAGASLVQIYTALIFHGPSLVKRINEEILNLLSKDGFNHISEAIGSDRR